MRTHNTFTCAAVAIIAAAAMSPALAIPTIDGTADAEYGAARSTQNTKTHFGDSTVGDLIVTGGGSELDQIFATVANGRLYVTVAGNLQNEFQKLEVYIDSVAGGVNTLSGANLPTGVDPFSGGGGALQRQNGLTFDAGFNADYYLTFTHGGENLNGLGFWALTAHYADLTQTTAGEVVAAGMQLAPQGMPRVLRGPLRPDFNSDFDVDGDDFLIWQRGLGTTPADKPIGDADDNDVVDGADLTIWRDRFADERTLADFSFNPFNGGPSTSSLLGPALPNLAQGELIDKNYVTANGLLAAELAFANAANRNMENTIDLEMALNNSNTAGVEEGVAVPWATAGNPGSVITGIEFSIPLAEIGNPTGDIKITSFVNNNEHNYASNQFSGVGIIDANLGGNGFGGSTPANDLSGVDLTDFAGDQFVTIGTPATVAGAPVPEPGSAVLVGIALAAGLRVLRRP